MNYNKYRRECLLKVSIKILKWIHVDSLGFRFSLQNDNVFGPSWHLSRDNNINSKRTDTVVNVIMKHVVETNEDNVCNSMKRTSWCSWLEFASRNLVVIHFLLLRVEAPVSVWLWRTPFCPRWSLTSKVLLHFSTYENNDMIFNIIFYFDAESYCFTFLYKFIFVYATVNHMTLLVNKMAASSQLPHVVMSFEVTIVYATSTRI